MARPGVSYEEVEKTAILIVGEGRIPTIEGVRMRLGTGSSTTLAAHLRRWKACNSDTRQLAMKENLPEEMVELMKGLWQRLRDESAMQVNAVRQTADKDINELYAAIQQLQQENNRLVQKHHIVLQEKNSLVAEQAVLRSFIDELKRENSVLSAKN